MQVDKKNSKMAPSTSSESVESSNSNGDLYKYPMKGKGDPKGQKATKGKKIETLEDTPQ